MSLKFPKISSDKNQTYTCVLPEKTGTIALINDLPAVPTKTSDLTNDSGFLTEETDPTVPAWAKESTKPAYTAAEVGALPDTTVIPEDKVFIATYGTTTYADTLAAYNAGKLIFAVYNNGTTNGKTIFPLTRKALSFFQFEGRYLNGLSQKRTCELSSSGWTTTSYFGDTITRTVDITSGDSLIIRDLDDNSTMKSSSLSFGTETNQYLANNGTWQTVPENVSDLTNDSGFQTSTEVNSAIATAIGNINQFNVAIVSTLPTENIDNHTIYFMSNGGSDDNIYDEWMYINNNWEKIGTTAVDLSGYMQTSHPANGITSTDITNWNAKISDDKTWNGVTLNKTSGMGSSNIYVPYATSAKASSMNYWSASETPNNYAIAKYDSSAYLKSTTPSANDNSTKVATTAYVDAAIPKVYSSTNTNGYLTMDTLPIYDGTVV